MKILLSNDDGVNASGILAAKQVAKEFGETCVVAPSKQQSGIGHALTLFESLRVKEVNLRDGDIGYGVSGTPTDAVTIGIYEIMNEKPDLVISGINTGRNTGKGELSTSGTLGAATEAASLGIPTIAVSQHTPDDDIKFDEGHIKIDFSSSQKILRDLIQKVIDNGFPKGIDLLNLNVPANPDSYDPIICPLADRMYEPTVEKRIDPRGRPYYWINGILYKDNPKYSDDYIIMEENLPTLTPLILDMTHNLDVLKEWYGK
ncbi:5'/3'-nucleotidase SurE [Methanobrevibacter olleyae]|nr:5'/3'-nucleotidase SurE [Methanobrevibacter olleyae]